MASPKTTTLLKDPDAKLNYTLNWSKWLDTGDTISSVSWISENNAITVHSSTNTTTAATVILSGGKISKKYRITCRITTANGLIDDRSFWLQIRER
jgi:hypothetical protein